MAQQMTAAQAALRNGPPKAPSVDQVPALFADAGVDITTYLALENAFPGARHESMMMALRYCQARKLDIMKKPVHIVPMNVKDAATQQYFWRDVIMPGIAESRITASRTQQHAGTDAPIFGPTIPMPITTDPSVRDPVILQVPEWCSVTVHKLVHGVKASYTHIEYYDEACARTRNGTINEMWAKRRRGQLSKCAEAGALRKAFPEELGGEATADEMVGKGMIETVGGDLIPDPDLASVGASGVAGPEEVVVDAEFTEGDKDKATGTKADPPAKPKTARKAASKRASKKAAPKASEPPAATPEPAPAAVEPAAVPEPTPEPAAAPVAQQVEPAAGTFTIELPGGAMSVLQAQMRGKGITDVALLTKLNASITTRNINEALALIKGWSS